MSGEPREQRLEPGTRGSGFQRGARDIRVQALQECQVRALCAVGHSHTAAAAASAAAAVAAAVAAAAASAVTAFGVPSVAL